MSNCKSDVKVLNQFLEKGLICSLGQNRCFANIIQVNGTQVIGCNGFSDFKVTESLGEKILSVTGTFAIVESCDNVRYLKCDSVIVPSLGNLSVLRVSKFSIIIILIIQIVLKAI
ncbi:hypothetical protein BB561_005207 [Smittium simulii]|uniref:Uncharacterized protein n=1 Tax=Smittium simulii TaxID=133385 RepID=A0A2T9YBG8_9FUNG|nr:hypothetical protein BB561_005207 [Smittium simulii]